MNNISPDLAQRLDGSVRDMLEARVRQYMENWTSANDHDPTPLTQPAVVYFRYSDAEKKDEHVSFHFMPVELAKLFLSNPAMKEVLAQSIDGFFEDDELAAAVVVISESWAVALDVESYKQLREEHKSVRTMPGSMTAIQGQVYTNGTVIGVYVQAMDKGKRHGALQVHKVRAEGSRILRGTEAVEIVH
jgi:hypothetical protein